jgi:uncharacterized membrane protein YbhN (UPF0104 family)
VKLDRKLVTRGLTAAVALAFAFATLELAQRFRAGAVQVEPGWLCAAVVLLGLGYTGQALGFHSMVQGAAALPQRRVVTLELFFRGLLARYLPGKVGIPAVRMAAAEAVTVSGAFMAASVVLESLAWLASGFILAMVLTLGPWAPEHLSQLMERPLAKVAVGSSLAGALLLSTLDCRYYPRVLLKFLRLQDRTGPLLPPVLMLSTGSFWLATACASAALALSLGASSDAALLSAAAGVAAPLLGFLVPVPAGLGVREAALVLALGSTLTQSGALAFGLVSRAAAMGTEVLLWLMSRWALRQSARSASQAS